MLLLIARLLLILDAAIFVVVGTFLFTGPDGLAYLNIVSGAGMTAIRTWGGMFIGIGMVGLIAACRKAWIRPGLSILFIIGSMVVLSRLYGIVVDGVEPRQISELRDESIGPLLALIGLILCWFGQRQTFSEHQSPRLDSDGYP